MNAASPEQQTFAQHYRNLQTSLDPGTVVPIAYSKGLLTQHEHSRATNSQLSNYERLEIFLNAIDRQIAENPDAFYTFVYKVLEEEPAFHHLVEKLMSTYRSLRSSAHPIEEVSGAVAIARQNRQRINSEFGDLLEHSCKKLREKQINIQDFCRFLEGFFPPGDCITESSSVDEIFKVISHNKLWDYWNYFPLQVVVRKFVGDDQEMNARFETYKKALATYKVTTKLVDYIDDVNSDTSGDDLLSEEEEQEKPEQQPAKYDKRYYRKLSFKLEARFTTHTLEYLDNLWKEFADLYNLPPLVTLLDCVYKNSISIVWLIPARIDPKLLRAAPHSVHFYCKHQITRVEFDGVCIYPEAKEYAEEREPVAKETVVKVDQQMQTELSLKDPIHHSTVTLLPSILTTLAICGISSSYLAKRRATNCPTSATPILGFGVTTLCAGEGGFSEVVVILSFFDWRVVSPLFALFPTCTCTKDSIKRAFEISEALHF